MTYHKENDYLIPDIEMNGQPYGVIGKYGRMRKTYLMEHKITLFHNFLFSNKLTEHLMNIEKLAQEKLDIIISQMIKEQGITESMKENNQMDWIKSMNSITALAEEIVLKEIIYK